MLSAIPTGDEQRTEVWRQARAGSVTGTGFQHVIAKLKNGAPSKARTTYRMKLVTERITGHPGAEINAPSLSWGKENEDAARIAYELYKDAQGDPVFVEPVGFQEHPTIPWVGTSPDGFVGERGIIEIKCPWDSAVHLLTIINASAALAKALLGGDLGALSQLPEEYVPQVQGNLWVTGRQWCDFVSYDPRMPEHLRLYVTRVERDDAYIARLEAETLRFLEELEENVALLLDPDAALVAPVAQLVAQPTVEAIAA